MDSDTLIGPSLEQGVADGVDAVEHLHEHDTMSRGEVFCELAQEDEGVVDEAGDVELFCEEEDADEGGDAEGDFEFEEVGAAGDEGRVADVEVAEGGFEDDGGVFGEDEGGVGVRLEVG